MQKFSNKKINRIMIFMLAISFVIIIIGCSKGDVLKGTWDLDGTTVYYFDGSGKGNMILPSNTYSFEYTITEGEKLVSIDFEDKRVTDCIYTYKINKDKLILSGSEGEESFSYEFTKTEDN